jgi:hypothetical protein
MMSSDLLLSAGILKRLDSLVMHSCPSARRKIDLVLHINVLNLEVSSIKELAATQKPSAPSGLIDSLSEDDSNCTR